MSHRLLSAVCAGYEREKKAFPQTKDIASLVSATKSEESTTKLNEEMLADYIQSSEECPPVNAIVGGVLANELLKCISKKGRPLSNVFCYSMLDGSGIIEDLSQQ